MTSSRQRTLRARHAFEGKGLHTGAYVHMTLCPAGEGTGYQLRRTDLPNQPMMRADARRVSYTQRGTVLAGDNGETVSTIEHLLSALRGCRVDNCLIELDGPEVPILDGSAAPYLDALRRDGLQEQQAPVEPLRVTHKLVYEEPDKGLSIIALPDDHFAAHVLIAFDGSRRLPNQWAQLESLDDYPAVASARTFVFLHEIKPLLSMGLIKGGDLQNAIVLVEQDLDSVQRHDLAAQLGRDDVTIHPSGVLNERDLQWPNEPARHKLLDLVGDLALTGRPIEARIIATRSGHASNTEFARRLLAEFDNH